MKISLMVEGGELVVGEFVSELWCGWSGCGGGEESAECGSENHCSCSRCVLSVKYLFFIIEFFSLFSDKKLLVFLLKLSHNSKSNSSILCVLVPRRHKMNWSNKGDVLKSVKKNGFSLQSASDELKKDKEIVLAAMNQNGLALGFASGELKNDKEIVLAAVKEDGRALKYASAELRNAKSSCS